MPRITVLFPVERAVFAFPPRTVPLSMTDRRAAHVYVDGRVQGVYFRATTRDVAESADVDGWVRNLDDGRVEAHFEGTASAVEDLVAFCREGPPRASVTDVDVERVETEGFEGFTVRR